MSKAANLIVKRVFGFSFPNNIVLDDIIQNNQYLKHMLPDSDYYSFHIAQTLADAISSYYAGGLWMHVGLNSYAQDHPLQYISTVDIVIDAMMKDGWK